MLWFSVLPVLSFLPFHVETRFFSPAFPALLIWLSKGIVEFSRWAGRTGARLLNRELGDRNPLFSQPGRRIASWTMGIVLVLLMLFLGAMHYRTVTAGMRGLSYAHKIAGLWLRDNTPSSASIMSRDLAIALYAERGFVVSPRAEYAAYIDYARRKGATHLVVDERELTVLRPHLALLGDPDDPPPGLRPVFVGSDANGRTIVYQLVED
jgi:hypothetical protein